MQEIFLTNVTPQPQPYLNVQFITIHGITKAVVTIIKIMRHS